MYLLTAAINFEVRTVVAFFYHVTLQPTCAFLFYERMITCEAVHCGFGVSSDVCNLDGSLSSGRKLGHNCLRADSKNDALLFAVISLLLCCRKSWLSPALEVADESILVTTNKFSANLGTYVYIYIRTYKKKSTNVVYFLLVCH